MKFTIKYHNGFEETLSVRQVVFKDGILKISTESGKLFEVYGEEFISFKIKED